MRACVYVKSSQGAAKFKSRLADLKGIPDSIYVCLVASGRLNAAGLNPQGRPIKVIIHHVLSGSLAINTSGVDSDYRGLHLPGLPVASDMNMTN